MTRPSDLGARYLELIPSGARNSLVREAARFQKAAVSQYESPGLAVTMASAIAKVQSAINTILDRWSADGTLDAIHTALRRLAETADLPGTIEWLNSGLLPPNLQSAAAEINATTVWDFLAEEGIPLYRVPRASIAVRLLQAPTHAARRRVLTTHARQICEDCSTALAECTSNGMREYVEFAQDGIRAMESGAYRSAQAVFTVTLDTLIISLVPNLQKRRTLTTRAHGTEIPQTIEEMNTHEAMVWLAVWNGHLEFRASKRHTIPYDYSRHAAVHAVSRRQYSKRNCVQSLMLLTSLISWADEHSTGKQ